MILDFLFPKKCLSCKKSGEYMCGNCIKRTSFGGNTYLKGLNIFSVWKYEGVIKKAIVAIKYKLATDVAEELVSALMVSSKNNKLFDKFINFNNSKRIFLVPIPMHWRKENERGFNQTIVLGKLVARKMNWDFDPNLLIKAIKTPPQVGLEGSKRALNLRGSFKVNKSKTVNLDSNILLFDDVLTTGSTLLEAKRALSESGFKNILALTIAG